MTRHPAGTFLISNCVGRDMSKFFYGGYKMEHAEATIQVNPYRHSMAARKIVQELVVANIESRAPEAYTKVTKKVDLAPGISNFHFAAIDGKKHWSLYYTDVRHMGKIFLVHDIDELNVQRQFTSCTTIRLDFFLAINQALKEFLEDKPVTFDPMLAVQKLGPEVVLTVKDFKSPMGLSSKMHRMEGQTFCVKGPMGKGLALRKKGTHIGFSAGVAIVYFLDLVTHLARKMMGLTSERENKMLEPGFKMVLFASFADEASAVGLDFLRMVDTLSKKTGMDLFEF